MRSLLKILTEDYFNLKIEIRYHLTLLLNDIINFRDKQVILLFRYLYMFTVVHGMGFEITFTRDTVNNCNCKCAANGLKKINFLKGNVL